MCHCFHCLRQVQQKLQLSDPIFEALLCEVCFSVFGDVTAEIKGEAKCQRSHAVPLICAKLHWCCLESIRTHR